MSDTTIVIGAGISGLSAASTLKDAGHDVLVLEATNRPGGRIVRVTRDGDAVEAGGQGIHSNYEEMFKLLERYDLKNDLVEQTNTQAAYLDRQGKLRFPKGNTGLADLVGWRGKLDLARFATQYMALSKKFSLFETDQDIPEYDNVTAADEFSWAGDDFRDFILRPSAHAMANTTPEHTNLFHYLNLMKLVASTKVMTLRTGNVTLCERIAEHVGVRYESPVSKILISGGRIDGVLLAGGETIKASHVIVACPARQASALMPESLSSAKDFLSAFPNAPFSLVYFFLDRPLPTEAYVFLGHPYRDVPFNMAINHTVKTPHLVPSGKAIISAWPSYPNAIDLAAQSENHVIAQALRDMDAFFPGIAGWVEDAHVQRHPWGVARLAPGQHAKILQFKRELESIPGIGFACTDYDGVHMESGVRSGIRAARRVLGEV